MRLIRHVLGFPSMVLQQFLNVYLITVPPYIKIKVRIQILLKIYCHIVQGSDHETRAAHGNANDCWRRE